MTHAYATLAYGVFCVGGFVAAGVIAWSLVRMFEWAGRGWRS